MSQRKKVGFDQNVEILFFKLFQQESRQSISWEKILENYIKSGDTG